MLFEEIISNCGFKVPKILDVGSGGICLKTTYLIDNYLNKGLDFKYCPIDVQSECQIFYQREENFENCELQLSDWLHAVNNWNNKEEPFSLTESQFNSHFFLNFGLDIKNEDLDIDSNYNLIIMMNLLHFIPKENWLQVIDKLLLNTGEKCEFYSEIFALPDMVDKQISFAENHDIQLFSSRFSIKEFKLLDNKFSIVGIKT
jgi:hypothetical protein